MRSVLLVAAVVLVSATALIRAYAELDEDFLAEWAGAHGLVITERNCPMVRWYLRNARVLRTWGALAGFFLPYLALPAFGASSAGSLPFVAAFVGYLMGALYAETSLVRPRPSGPRAASLVPRQLGAYLPRGLRMAQRVLGATIAGVSLVVLSVPYPPDGMPGPHGAWLILGMIGGPALAFGLERLQKWLVRRPQPFTCSDLVAADDAVRAQSVHSVSGSGMAVELVWLGALAFSLAQSDVQFLRWTMWVAGLACMGAAVGACQIYGHVPWRVRRDLPWSSEREATA
jgi:hypothetical protein